MITMKYFNFLVAASCLLSTVPAMAQWSVVGPNATVTTTGIGYSSLAKDATNNLYVSYSAGLAGGAVQKFDGTNWSVLGTGATPGTASYGTIGVTTAGEVYYAFQDGSNGSKLSVRKYDPVTAAWSNSGVGISDNIVNYQQLKISPGNVPVVSYFQATTNPGIYVKRYNGTAWVNVGVNLPIIAGSGTAHSMTVGNNDTVFVAVQVGANYSVYKAHISAASASDWTLVGAAGFTAGASSNQFIVSIAADQNNHLYLAYRATSSPSSGKIAVYKYDGTWNALGTQYFSTGNVEHISVAVTPGGTPYVAFRDNTQGKAYVFTYDGAAWQDLGAVSTALGNWNNITVNSAGEPIVCFAEGTGVSSGLVTVKKYSAPVIVVDSVVVNTVGNVAATIITNGGTLPLAATVYPLTTAQTVTWSIVPVTGMATVNATGIVTAQSNGTVWAKAVSTLNTAKSDSVLITISNQVVPIDSIRVRTQANVAPVITTNAGTLQMTATVYPAAASQAVTWSIIPVSGTATINASGLVTAATNGTVWAKAIAAGNTAMSDSMLVTISGQTVAIDSVVAAVQGSGAPAITIHQGTLQMRATVYPAAANQNVSWAIVPVSGTASVSATGLVTAISNGTVWAKAVSTQDASKSDSVLITISNQNVSVPGIVKGYSFSVYPNPVINTVAVSVNDAHPALALVVTDVYGKQVLREHFSPNSLTRPYVLNMQPLPSGVYFLQLTGKDININQKIVKE